MAKVICAVLRYTDDEKSLIIEQEKLRQAVSYLNEVYLNLFSFCYYLALDKFVKIILIYFNYSSYYNYYFIYRKMEIGYIEFRC